MGVFNNLWLCIPIITWFIAQSLKILFELLRYKKLNIRRICGSGGMPSSHSALVCSLATAIALTEGIDSPMFAISVLLALIVMYDASGVRRAAGKQARILNQIIENEGKKINVQEKLVELLGHSPIEVYVGAIIGIAMAVLLVPLWR